MSDDASSSPIADIRSPEPGPLLRYVEEMVLELAQLSASAGEPGLAASLAIAAIQAGAAADRRQAG